jgi:hypothetical protein
MAVQAASVAARAVIYDPPYIRYSPMRGQGPGRPGSIAAPISFMHRTMRLYAQAVQLKGIVMIFCDGEPLGVIAYTASIAGLRERAAAPGLVPVPARRCGLFRGACAPVWTSPERAWPPE